MRRRKREGSDALGVVGWVFADLLLGLALVFLATQPGNPDAGRSSSPATTTTTSTTTSTTTTSEPGAPPGVDSQFICIRVDSDPNRLTQGEGPDKEAYVEELKAQLDLKLQAAGLGGRRAGLVLLLGSSSTPGPGKAYAETYNEAVLKQMPDAFAGSARRAFWGGGGNPYGSIELNVYPLVGPGLPPVGNSGRC